MAEADQVADVGRDLTSRLPGRRPAAEEPAGISGGSEPGALAVEPALRPAQDAGRDIGGENLGVPGSRRPVIASSSTIASVFGSSPTNSRRAPGRSGRPGLSLTASRSAERGWGEETRNDRGSRKKLVRFVLTVSIRVVNSCLGRVGGDVVEIVAESAR